MRKNEDHGYQCGCLMCKPRDVTDPSTDDTADWPLIRPEPERTAQPERSYRRTAFIGSAFTVLALGCCWASPPTLLDTYRETMAVARECWHRPRCQAHHVHQQRLAVDEHCYHGPAKCARLEECFKKHIEEVFATCDHSPICSAALGHFNAVRREQGLAHITLP